MIFTANDARTYLDTRAGRAAQRECSQCHAVDPPTTVADALGGERVVVHDGCPARDGLVLPTLYERSIPLLGADECRAACESVVALTAQLAATEAEARTALDALHARCDAAEAEAQRLRAARLDDAARHATECVRWGDRKVELLGRVVELEAALKAAQPALLLDAIRRGPAVMCCNPPPVDDAPPEPDVFEALDDIFESAAVDDAPDEPPQPFTLDVGVDSGGRWWVIEVSDGLRAGMSENDPAAVYAGLAAAIAAHYGDAAQLAALAGARFAEEHPAAAAGIVGACVAPKGEP